MKKTFTYYLTIYSFISLVACQSNTYSEVTQEIEFKNVIHASNDAYENVCEIDQSEVLVEYFMDIEFVNDTTILLINGETANLYNINGKHIKQLGNKGRGPGEYLNAITSYISDEYIYIHCPQSNKINLYNFNGEFVKSYTSPYAATKFQILGDSVFYAYSTYMRDESYFIKKYDFKNNNLQAAYGNPTDVDELLMGYNLQGDLELCGKELYYVAPSKLEVNVIKGGESKTPYRIINSEFKVDLESEYLKKREAYLFAVTNGAARSIHLEGDYIYLLATTGVQGKQNGTIQTLNIFKLSKNGEPIQQTVLENNMTNMMSPHCYYKGYLYCIRYNGETSAVFIERVKL